jgi:F-type H+-transporting ATPase subunit b
LRRHLKIVGIGLLLAVLGLPSRLAARRFDMGGTMLAFAQEEGQAEQENKRELLFKTINFALLAGALIYLCRKPLGEFFARRTALIRQELEDGRKALESAQAQLQAVEEKLSRLQSEIAEFRASAEREMEAERQRLRQAAREEAAKILEATRAQIEASTRAGKLELRVYAASQAVQLAEQLIRQRLDEPTRQRLFGRFVAELDARDKQN